MDDIGNGGRDGGCPGSMDEKDMEVADGGGAVDDAAAKCCKALSCERSKLGCEGGVGVGATAEVLLRRP